MAKQILKSLTMLTLVVGLALVLNAGTANGQLSSHLVTADIPFEFIVGDQTFPSGKYTVTKASDNGKVLRITSLDGKSSVVRLSNSVTELSTKRNARIVFHRYGQEHFLAEVWSGDNSTGRQLIQSEKERELQQERSLIASSRDSSKKIVEVLALH